MEEKHLSRLLALIEKNYIYILSLPTVKAAILKGDENYSLLNDKVAMRKLNAYLAANSQRFEITLLNAVQEEAEVAAVETQKTINKHISKLAGTRAAEITIEKATQTAREAAKLARDNFNAERNGFNVSERVWRTYGSIPKEAEVMIENAIKEGKSAEDIARELKKFLKQPQRLYRRVKNPNTGKLEWSRAAKEYHPGQGVYRSAYKNAMRLARTEINKAYKEAEWNGYQNNDQVYGFEVVLSNNKENRCETCIRLAGVYPKWFKWHAWHPQCRCRMVPVMMPREDWKKLLKLRFEGRESEFKPNFIDDLPPQFTTYLIEKKERILGAASLPYWLEDNKEKLKNYL